MIWRRAALFALSAACVLAGGAALADNWRGWQGTYAEQLPDAPATGRQSTSGEVSVLFVGDLMFDRYIRMKAETFGGNHLFSCMQNLFAKADLVVGNLEGPITPHPSKSAGSAIGSPNNFTFTFPTTTAALLARHNLRVVSLGNNHIGNFGSAGIASTQAYLTEAGVGYFGGLLGDEPVYRTTLNGVPLSFVSYNQFGGQAPESVARIIAAERASGNVVIVYTHWGNEYAEASESQRRIAALFAHSGSSLIIGSHPHVIQETEMIGTVPVFYSLGNFIFDQYWNEDVRTGQAVLAHISKGDVAAEIYTVELNRDGRTCLKE